MTTQKPSKSSNKLTVDFNKLIVTLKNEETEHHLGNIIADAISSCGSEQCKTLKPSKLVGWAIQLANHEQLELDQTDFDLLREFITLLPRLNILVLTQADTCFKIAKDLQAS